MKEDTKKRTLILPTKLYNRLLKRAKSTGFSSVEEYVIFVLEKTLEEGGGEIPLTPKEEEEVKKNLRALGYLG